MRTPYRQRGVSWLAWLAILFVVGFFALFGAKTVPAYYSYYTLLSVAQSVQTSAKVEGLGPQEMRSMLRKRMRINDVDNVTELGYDVITIEPARDGFALVIEYEVRNTLFANVDVVVSFYRRVVR